MLDEKAVQLDLFSDTLSEDDEANIVEEKNGFVLVQNDAADGKFEYKVFDKQTGVAITNGTFTSSIDALSMPTSEYSKGKIHALFLRKIWDEKTARREYEIKQDQERSQIKAKSYTTSSPYRGYGMGSGGSYGASRYNSYSSYGSGYSSYYQPKPKSTGFLDKLNKSDTLVIHCEDRSTDMLSQIYNGKGWDVLRDGNIDKTELHELLKTHDRIVCLGHGTSNGLMNIQGWGGPTIGSEEAPYLKDKKLFVIWCNADKYFESHGIGNGQFITGNMPSEVGESIGAGCGDISRELMLENITYWSKLCADVVERALGGDAKGAVEYVRSKYLEKYGNHPVTIYNAERTKVQGDPTPDFFDKYWGDMELMAKARYFSRQYADWKAKNAAEEVVDEKPDTSTVDDIEAAANDSETSEVPTNEDLQDTDYSIDTDILTEAFGEDLFNNVINKLNKELDDTFELEAFGIASNGCSLKLYSTNKDKIIKCSFKLPHNSKSIQERVDDMADELFDKLSNDYLSESLNEDIQVYQLTSDNADELMTHVNMNAADKADNFYFDSNDASINYEVIDNTSGHEKVKDLVKQFFDDKGLNIIIVEDIHEAKDNDVYDASYKVTINDSITEDFTVKSFTDKYGEDSEEVDYLKALLSELGYPAELKIKDYYRVSDYADFTVDLNGDIMKYRVHNGGNVTIKEELHEAIDLKALDTMTFADYDKLTDMEKDDLYDIYQFSPEADKYEFEDWLFHQLEKNEEAANKIVTEDKAGNQFVITVIVDDKNKYFNGSEFVDDLKDAEIFDERNAAIMAIDPKWYDTYDKVSVVIAPKDAKLYEGSYHLSPEHADYVVHNVIAWRRSYSPAELTPEAVAVACYEYDPGYSVDEYIKVIKKHKLLDEYKDIDLPKKEYCVFFEEGDYEEYFDSLTDAVDDLNRLLEVYFDDEDFEGCDIRLSSGSEEEDPYNWDTITTASIGYDESVDVNDLNESFTKAVNEGFYLTRYEEDETSGPEEGGYTSYGYRAVESQPMKDIKAARDYLRQLLADGDIDIEEEEIDLGKQVWYAIDSWSNNNLKFVFETDPKRGSEHSPAKTWAQAEFDYEPEKPEFKDNGYVVTDQDRAEAKRDNFIKGVTWKVEQLKKEIEAAQNRDDILNVLTKLKKEFGPTSIDHETQEELDNLWIRKVQQLHSKGLLEDLVEAVASRIVYCAEYYEPKLDKWIRMSERSTKEAAEADLDTPVIGDPKKRVTKYEKSGVRKITYKEITDEGAISGRASSYTFDELKALEQGLYASLKAHDIHPEDGTFFNSSNRIADLELYLVIDGDWKHDHILTETLVEEFCKANKLSIIRTDSKEIGSSHDDWYKAEHTWWLADNTDGTTDTKIDGFRRLFSKSIDEAADDSSEYFNDEGKEVIQEDLDVQGLEAILKDAAVSKVAKLLDITEEEAAEQVYVDINSTGVKNSYHVEVRAELTYTGLEQLCEVLNSIIIDYDSNAYFDMVDVGIIDTYIRVKDNAVTEQLLDADHAGSLCVELEQATDFATINAILSSLSDPEDEPSEAEVILRVAYEECCRREFTLKETKEYLINKLSTDKLLEAVENELVECPSCFEPTFNEKTGLCIECGYDEKAWGDIE